MPLLGTNDGTVNILCNVHPCACYLKSLLTISLGLLPRDGISGSWDISIYLFSPSIYLAFVIYLFVLHKSTNLHSYL